MNEHQMKLVRRPVKVPTIQQSVSTYVSAWDTSIDPRLSRAGLSEGEETCCGIHHQPMVDAKPDLQPITQRSIHRRPTGAVAIHRRPMAVAGKAHPPTAVANQTLVAFSNALSVMVPPYSLHHSFNHYYQDTRGPNARRFGPPLVLQFHIIHVPGSTICRQAL